MEFSLSIAAESILKAINNSSSSSNVVLSPMSITLVLNMLAHGSDGDTLDQFLTVLGSEGVEELSSKSNEIMSLLVHNSENTPQSPPPSSPLPRPPPSFPDNGVSWSQPPPPFFGYSPNFSSMPLPQHPELNPLPPPKFVRRPNPTSMPPPPLYPRLNPLPPPFHNVGIPPEWLGSVPPPWNYFSSSSSLPTEPKPRNTGKDPIFRMVNALWVDHSASLTSYFAEIADSIYRARVKSVDLRNKADEVKEEVNAWAEKETNGLIKELLSKQTKLEPPLCLGNALYFKGSWKTPFEVTRTRDQDFHLLNGQTIKVPFMINRNESYFYGSFDHFKLLELPYEHDPSAPGRRFSMYIFLPHDRDGLESLARKLCSEPETLNPSKFRLSWEELDRVVIPKLKFESEFNCVQCMKAKGLTLPFCAGADFSNLACTRESIYVKFFLHKAFIEVNEEGTEAAAVTFCGMACGCAAMGPRRPPPSFVADHPFMFMIVEKCTDIVVFTGAVLNPKSTESK